MLKPKIRFSDFTAEWQPLSLGDITHFKRGYDLPSSQRIDGDFPIISSSGYSGHHSEYKVNGPGLVTGRYGSIGEIYLVKEPHWPLNTALYVDNLFDNNIIYCYFLLQTIDFKKFSDKTGVPGVNRNDLHKIKTAIPSTQEQQKIADFLSSVDTKISQLTEKHRLLKKYKKGVMQQIFSQKIRFKDEDGLAFPDWKERVVSELSTKVGSGSTPKGGSEAYSKQGIKFIRSQNINNEKLDLFDVVFISDEINQKMKGSIVKPLDVLLNITGASIGRSCVVPASFDEGNVNQHVCIIRTTPELNPYYLQLFLSGYQGQKIIFQSQAGGGREGLNFEAIRSFKIPLPCIEEQLKIAEFLQSLDSKINAVAEQIEQNKQFKKGLLQQMFA
ncbi:restriction endonuclease subunit S [Vibrio vulnificus]|uniref:restriction endonuclease subunit S n=1 Tax=Vibrio vulnificus TaxID=672 RepID=UPI00324D57A2